jgi:3-oxoadipate enol-lactonase
LTDRDAFRLVAPQLVQRFRLILVNLPGFHGSRPIEGTLDGYEGWVDRAFIEYGVGADCILGGNGFGGTIALAFALKNQEKIRKLLLADVAAAFPEEGKVAFRTMAEMVTRHGMGAIASIAAGRVYHDAYVAQNPEVIEERRQVLCAIEPTAFIAACNFLVACNLVPQLTSLLVPTLVVYGDKDQATPPVLNNAIAKALPHCSVTPIDDCGHCPPLEKPTAFLSAIDDFVSS